MKKSCKSTRVQNLSGKETISAGTDSPNCLSRLKTFTFSKSKNSSVIARYLLANTQKAAHLTISELARETGASVATISRFCNRLGYRNYRAFNLALAFSLTNTNSPISDIFQPGDRPGVIVKKVFAINRQSLSDTEAIFKIAELNSVAKLFNRGGKIFLFGTGGSGLIARIGALRFMALGITTSAISDSYEGILALSSSAENDVVIGISHSGRSTETLNMIRLSRSKGLRTVGITNYPDSPLAKSVDFLLLTSFPERRVNAAVSSSRISQMCILDALYFLAAYHQGRGAEKAALDVEASAEKFLR